MVAILGTFLASSSNFTFESLVHGYKNLPKEVLSTAPASCAFMKGTPGPRYLVLTASRIETLQHICFVSLLHNIHEALWPTSWPILPNTEAHSYSIKKSKAGIDFRAVAWWSLSGVEKTRIMRAYWNLIIYWNIQEICPDLITADDYDFSKYRATIKRIDPYFRPFSLTANPVEEMKCVLGATREFMSFSHDLRLFTPFTSRQSSKFGLEKWVFTIVFEENPCWRFQERKQVVGHRVGLHTLLKRRDKLPKDFSSGHSNSKPGDDDQFIDCLGICIWVGQRLSWVALGSEFYIRSSRVRAWTLAQNRARTRSRAISKVDDQAI